jgi:hypothetical protein
MLLVGELTKLFPADKNKISLRTTIPIPLVKQWNLSYQ